MTHLIGFIFAVAMIQTAFYLLGMDAAYYYDDIALLVVFGGTICAALITYNASDLAKMLKAFIKIAKKSPEQKVITVRELIKLSQAANKSKQALIEEMEKPTINLFLKDGLEMMLSGFQRDEIETIMRERIYRDREREERYGMLIRTISKYPPAFGLVGTVLGLVTLMVAVSGGADAAEIGTKMALALVATFYGLVLTNLVLIPASENLLNKSELNKTRRELLLDGLLMIYDKRSPMVVQEYLNSYLPPLQRDDVIGIGPRSDAA